MSDEIIIEKLEKIFYECNKHILRINSATKKMAPLFPITVDRYIKLTDDEVEHVDQFLFRFAKLQDTMGQKLFKTVLLFLREDIEGKPFIDILNLMEKLNLIKSADIWKDLRSNRNELAHNYEDEPEQMSETINTLYKKKDILIGFYKDIEEYYNLKVKNV